MRAIGLEHADARNAAAVGHKAANLARFAATFRVPPAFCLATSVYDDLHAALTPDGARERAELRTLVEDAYARLGTAVGESDPRVAVRSSATGEDSADASFAGQHETILDVAGVDAVVDAVLECWRSVGNERVTAYRKEKGITDPVSVAVLVQQMVPSDVSAIAFGIDPVSGDRDVVVIDAAPGLGDRIASGEVTPDRYVVRKTDLGVTAASGATLDETQAAEVAKLVIALERENGHEVDVECAFAGGDLYLLQCRPVTTAAAFPVVWRYAGDEKLHWRRDDAHHNAPVPRLVTDGLELGASRGMQRRAELFDLPLRPRSESFCGRIYVTAERRVPHGDLVDLGRRATERVRADARGARERWEHEHIPRLYEHYAWIEARTAEMATLPRVAVASAWDEVWRRFGDIWVMHMVTVQAAFAMGDELADTYERLTSRPASEALQLLQGHADSLHQLERDLHRLIELRKSGDAAAFDVAFREFLASPHGNLGDSDMDVRTPVWRDDRERFSEELDRRGAMSTEHPDVRRARLLAQGDAIAARARELLRDRPDDLATFEEVLAVARKVAPLTEEHNYHLDRQIQGVMRRLDRAVGARLVADGQLDTTDDVFLFHQHEITAALRYGTPLHELARARAAELAAWRRLRHPTTLGAKEGLISRANARADLLSRQQQDDASVMKGVPASGGVGRGRARLIRTVDEFAKVRPGDVLVCRSSNVSWVPLFAIASAVVTDVGGSLSHAAVVAREFGVPAVVGCGVALERLRDGDLIEVDGDRGVIRRIGDTLRE